MEKGVQRWIVNISKWNPTPHDFSSALSLLPQHEQSSITRFVRMEDRKRALVSRLLQYALIVEVLGISYDQFSIKRTLEGKPYLKCDTVGLEVPNFNFNVSHDGDYVAIASEHLCLVGVDIVSCVAPQKETVPEFIRNFSAYFSSLEWKLIVNAGTDDSILGEFYRYWCLKEAYVKAIGIGVSQGLQKVEFHHNNWTDISVKIDGESMAEWRFWLFMLPNKHWVSVARGHPRSAAESYKRTMKQAVFGEEEYQNALSCPSSGFVERTVEQLMSGLHGTDR